MTQELNPKLRAALAASGLGKPPSLLQKAGNFVAAVGQHLASGMQRATDDERARRLSICQACPHYVDKRCNRCGCGVTDEAGFIDKLGWAEQRCPVGNW